MESFGIIFQVEAELAELSASDRLEYLESLGVSEGGLGSLVRATYRLLGLRTYFTCGEKVGKNKEINDKIRPHFPKRCSSFYLTVSLLPPSESGQETRAWTIQAGMTAPQAAGVIHSDFERGFIRAETVRNLKIGRNWPKNQQKIKRSSSFSSLSLSQIELYSILLFLMFHFVKNVFRWLMMILWPQAP